MPMAIQGVAKLIEECGELQQVLGKRLAYWTTDQHPDGTNLVQRLEQEMGDVMAAIQFVAEQTGLSWQTIMARRDEKLRTYERWPPPREQPELQELPVSVPRLVRRGNREHLPGELQGTSGNRGNNCMAARVGPNYRVSFVVQCCGDDQVVREERVGVSLRANGSEDAAHSLSYAIQRIIDEDENNVLEALKPQPPALRRRPE